MKSFKEFIGDAPVVSPSVSEGTKKVDEYNDIDIIFSITMYDDQNSKDVATFKGEGTIIDVHTTGTSTSFSSDKYGDDEDGDLTDDYEDATFEVSKETETAISEWLAKNGYKEEDRDFVELNFAKQKVDLNIMVVKI